MDVMQNIFSAVWPLFMVILIACSLIWLSHRLAPKVDQGEDTALKWQVVDLFIVLIALVFAVIALPLDTDTQGQVLSLLGVVLTGVIGLSSTAFVANGMAGLMLQISRPFRPGDWVTVNDEFGRVISVSLMQTRIQTQTRDVTTLPNLYLIKNPVTVAHRDSTVISTDISLGYDVPHTQVQELLETAASETGLEEPFVMVQDLLDHAVLYRIGGLLKETHKMLSKRSQLRKCILEQLHGHGVEIVSPGFINQRQLSPEAQVIPKVPVVHDTSQNRQQNTSEDTPEDWIFDEAEEAANLEELKQRLEQAKQQRKEDSKALKDTANEQQRSDLEARLKKLDRAVKYLEARIAKKQDKPS
ncbi:MAG: mechanosensitive ion channel protein MscS [Gammaproteobacteria bacterium]|nr:MAG: mechanosensitive ion channel protein MscS [Gammaproteobacteria bacterium]